MPPRAVGTTFHAGPFDIGPFRLGPPDTSLPDTSLPAPNTTALVPPAHAEVTALIGGDVYYFAVAPGQTLLEAAVEAGLDLPRSCPADCRGACRCTLAGGTVDMPDGAKLTVADLGDAILGDAILGDAVLGDAVLGDAVLGGSGRATRQILACVAKPTSAWVILEFD